MQQELRHGKDDDGRIEEAEEEEEESDDEEKIADNKEYWRTKVALLLLLPFVLKVILTMGMTDRSCERTYPRDYARALC